MHPRGYRQVENGAMLCPFARWTKVLRQSGQLFLLAQQKGVERVLSSQGSSPQEATSPQGVTVSLCRMSRC